MSDLKKKIILILLVLIGLACSSPVSGKERYYFGFCPKYNPRIMYQLYQPFIDYLSPNTPYLIVLITSDSLFNDHHVAWYQTGNILGKLFSDDRLG